MLGLQNPVLKLRISGQEALKKCFLYLKMYNDVEFLLVDAPIFAYEPTLKRLQGMAILPLKEELFLYEKGKLVGMSGLVPLSLACKLDEEVNSDISDILGTTKPVKLDWSQLRSLVAGLTQRVSLIQGPPGMKHQILCSYCCGTKEVTDQMSYRYRKVFHRRTACKDFP